MNSLLERFFHLSESGTTIRTEVLAGLTTFMTMSYIIFVQPAVLSTTGMDFQAVLATTCIASALGTFLMAFLANSPVVSYIESAAGVAEGAKTGLANVVTGLLMLAGLFFQRLGSSAMWC